MAEEHPTNPPEATEQPRTLEDRARALYPTTAAQQDAQEPTKWQREATDPAVKMFGNPSRVYGDIDTTPLVKALGVEPDRYQAAGAKAQHVFMDAGLYRNEAEQLTSLLAQGLREPPTNEQVDRWHAEVERSLGQMYGQDWAAQRRLASEYVAQHPELHQILHETGLGSQPDVVRLLLEVARRKATTQAL